MKKKLLLAAIFVTFALWVVTGLNPFQLSISFLAAGALPGFTVSPYIMFALALIGGAAIVFKLSVLELHSLHPTQAGKGAEITALQIRAHTRKDPLKNRRRFTRLPDGKTSKKTKKH